MKYGVKEYWIIDIESECIIVYFKEEDKIKVNLHKFEDKIKVNIFDDFEIDFKALNL